VRPGEFVVGSVVGFGAETSFQKEGEGGGDGVLLRLLRGEAEPSDIVRGLMMLEGEIISMY
jgi:hypothetical protein